MASSRSAGFIVSPAYDVPLILLAPLLALGLGFLVSLVSPDDDLTLFAGVPAAMSGIALRTVIHAHLFAVLARSHGNQTVFRQHRGRFVVVPLVLFAAMMASKWVLVSVLVVTTFWDIYHSSMQTFGIGRIYDARAGADVRSGRAADIWINHVIYIGPVLAGPMFVVLLQAFDQFHLLNFTLLDVVAPTVIALQPWITGVVVVVGVVSVVGYVGWQWSRLRRGAPLSAQKVLLLTTTALTCFWAWGFNSFGQALLIVNVFHAVQYFAIVWWSEGKNLSRLFGLADVRAGMWLSVLCAAIVVVTYGFWVAATSEFWVENLWLGRVLLVVTNLVALLHFWYDGFIWSVRAKTVPL